MTSFTQDLRQGSVGAEVYRLQGFLRALGHFEGIQMPIFGPKTRYSVSLFQKRHNIKPSAGNFGPLTRAKMNEIISTNQNFFYWVADGCLGQDASPRDIASDEFSCSETVQEIYRKAFGKLITEPRFMLSTYQLFHGLVSHKDFEQVFTPQRGDIILSPTNMGNGKLRNGHTGICGDGGVIMSSNSFTGNFEQNYTQQSWRDRYQKIGGFPVFYFRRKN